jgi:hypothetical protein
MMSARHMLDTKICIYLRQNRPPEVTARGVATGIDARSGSASTKRRFFHGLFSDDRLEATGARKEQDAFKRGILILTSENPRPSPTILTKPFCVRNLGFCYLLVALK